MPRCTIVGLDGSAPSRHAASIASRLARDLHSHAVLVQVQEAPGLLRRLPPASTTRSRRIRRSLKAVAEEHCFPDGTETRVRTGHPASTLVEIAEREEAELMVVATGGRGTVSTGLLGSVAAALLRDAPCPVVVVPDETIAPLDAEGMRSIVCGVAGAETDPAALRLADDLAARLSGQLYAVHAYDPGADAGSGSGPLETELRDAAEDRLDSVLATACVEAVGVVAPLPPVQAIEQAAERHNAGLIVVGFGGYEAASTILGPVPTRLATEGRTAVVVLPLGTRLEPGSGHYEVAAGAV
jgi:nucleotide-binding universal stress UspA family protein